MPALPLCGFLFLLFFGAHCSRLIVATIGVLSIALSFFMTVGITVANSALLLSGKAIEEILWAWIPPINIGFYLDSLSLLMSLVVTLVSTLIALYSVKFMEEDTDTARFFANMNLFVAAMLILVLADNMLLLFAGFEGVGLCSYLLIGFWYQKSGAPEAMTKAFLTTRLGDVFFLLGIASILINFGTVNIHEFLTLAKTTWADHQPIATITALLLLAGAVGKSAQIPLQTWLPDAMIGPTPVSALIHAATMVTAGVYLLARVFPLFMPEIKIVILAVGAATMLIGCLSALAQYDLKRVLAYSTMSQIGLMFMAIGLGAPAAAMFHFTTHAFFKALLFLSAGVIGQALHHQYDMRKMGGLYKTMPFTFFSFLIGSLALAALPYVTAGFFSKELIMVVAYNYGIFWWAIGIAGAFLTALYTFRMVTMVFFGSQQHRISFKPTWLMTVPLGILVIASVCLGLVKPTILNLLGFAHNEEGHAIIIVTASLASLMGMLLALVLFGKIKFSPKFLAQGFMFDALYSVLIIKPYNSLAFILKQDCFTALYEALIRLTVYFHHLAGRTQTGRLRQYLTVVVASAIAVMGLMVLS